MPATSYYPAFLDLTDKACLVVGGGRVAERKALSLLRAGARVTVVSPELTAGLARRAGAGQLRHVARRFRPSDLKGAWLVIAATDDETANHTVATHAGLVNVVDRPELCSFIVPATVERGPLTIAVSTGGSSPAMARAIRRDIEASYGPAFGRYLRRLRTLRLRAARVLPPGRQREAFLKSLASERAVRDLRRGRMPRLPELPTRPSR